MISLIIIIVTTTVLAYTTTLIAAPPHTPSWSAFHVPLILYTIFGIFHLGAATYFLRGIRGFTSEFKKAYLYITGGVIVLGLSQLQTPILQAMNLWQSAWVAWSGPDITYLTGIVLLLIGLWRLAGFLHIKTLFSVYALLGLFVIGTVIALAVPYVSSVTYGLTNLQYRWNLLIIVQAVMFVIILLSVAYQVWRNIGAYYRKSSFWLMTAIFSGLLSSLQTALFAYIGYESFYVQKGFYSLVPVVVATLYLRAGYSFIKMTQEQDKRTAQFNSLDLISYAAGLVSNPADIDELLDNMRVISVRASSNAVLSDADQATLATIYTGIESYLASRDPARHYTKEALRAKMAREFDFEHNATPVFWQRLS